MNDDLLRRLREQDPAAGELDAGTSEAACERLRADIVAGRVAPRSGPVRPGRRRRLALAIAIAVAVLLLGGSAVYGAARLLEPLPKPAPDPSPTQITRAEAGVEYALWTTKLRLPPGAEWRGYDGLYTDPVKGHYEYSGEGIGQAVVEAIGCWAQEWVDAAKAGDSGRVELARLELARLRDVITPSSDGAGGISWEPSMFEFFDRTIASAEKGDFSDLGVMAGWARRPMPLPQPSASPSKKRTARATRSPSATPTPTEQTP